METVQRPLTLWQRMLPCDSWMIEFYAVRGGQSVQWFNVSTQEPHATETMLLDYARSQYPLGGALP